MEWIILSHNVARLGILLAKIVSQINIVRIWRNSKLQNAKKYVWSEYWVYNCIGGGWYVLLPILLSNLKMALILHDPCNYKKTGMFTYSFSVVSITNCPLCRKESDTFLSLSVWIWWRYSVALFRTWKPIISAEKFYKFIYFFLGNLWNPALEISKTYIQPYVPL